MFPNAKGSELLSVLATIDPPRKRREHSLRAGFLWPTTTAFSPWSRLES
jgi:hypothetical protein